MGHYLTQGYAGSSCVDTGVMEAIKYRGDQ